MKGGRLHRMLFYAYDILPGQSYEFYKEAGKRQRQQGPRKNGNLFPIFFFILFFWWGGLWVLHLLF